jgi:hypothetical protein
LEKLLQIFFKKLSDNKKMITFEEQHTKKGKRSPDLIISNKEKNVNGKIKIWQNSKIRKIADIFTQEKRKCCVL